MAIISKENKSIDTESAIKYFTDAIDLTLKIANWENDAMEIKQGVDIFYTVDTNILIMYSNPYKALDYSRVFYDDEDSVHIAKLIAEHIFFKIKCRFGKLFVTPPHKKEIINVIAAILRAAEALPKYIYITSEELIKAQQLNSLMLNNNIYEYTQELIKCAPTIFNLFNGDPCIPIVELRNLMRLVGKGGRIIETTSLPELACENHEFYKIFTDVLEYCSLNCEQYVDIWDGMLSDKMRKLDPLRRYRKREDALALGWIECANKYFRTNDINSKILFVTGDDYIAEAGRQRFPYVDEKLNFNDLYIRHPMGCISTVLKHSETSNVQEKFEMNHKSTGILEWLNIFLSPIGKATDPDYHEQLLKFKYLTNQGKSEKFKNWLSQEPKLLKKISEYIRLIPFS